MIAVLLTAAVLADPPTRQIAVEVVDRHGRAVAGVRVVAEPQTGTGQQQAAVRIAEGQTNRVGTAQLDLSSAEWSVRGVAVGQWSWPERVGPTQSGTRFRLVMLPAATVSGDVPASLDAGSMKAVVRQRFGPVASLENHEAIVACNIQGRRFTCDVPASETVDLELRLPGFAPQYLWEVKAPASSSHSLSALRWLRGGSVSGWVSSEQGRMESGARIDMRRPGLHPAHADTEATRIMQTNARGFFQIAPVPAGQYHVSASRDGRTSQVTVARIGLDREERLAPLVLRRPATLGLSVEPPTDSEDQRWFIGLMTWDGTHGDMVVRRERASEEGHWSRVGLVPGQYRVRVLRATGDAWHDALLDVEPGANNHHIVVRTLHVSGSVSVGGKAVGGSIRLIEQSAHVQASFELNEKGEFSGAYPRVEPSSANWTAILKTPEPRVQRTLESVKPESATQEAIRFSIQLPDGVIEGTVVDELGRPVASVVATQEQDPKTSSAGFTESVDALSDAVTGRFSIPGLPPGEYRLHATGRGRDADALRSNTVSATVGTAGGPSNVRLVLSRAGTVEGRVTTSTGLPAVGARVVAVPAEAPDVAVRLHTTDDQGRFTARVPPMSRRIVLSIAAPEIGYRVMGTAIPDSGPIDVVLDAVGGTLVVDPGTLGDMRDVRLFHDGGFDFWLLLEAWSRRHGGHVDGRWRLPYMAPGYYRMCRVGGLSDHQAFMSGALPGERCADGTLSPGGELRMNIPPPTSP